MSHEKLIDQIDTFYDAVKNPLKFPMKQLLNMSIINHLANKFNLSPDEISDKIGERGHKIINIATDLLLKHNVKDSIIEFIQKNSGVILGELNGIIESQI